MPSTRTRRRRSHQPAISPMQWALLNDLPRPTDAGLDGDFDYWSFCWDADDAAPWGQKPTARQLWTEHGAVVLAEWVVEHPGTRPSTWWRVAAPGPRVRIGGIGTAAHERLANVLRLHCGIPLDWIVAGDMATYEALGRPLEVPAVDPKNPPMFESQATYLDRHNLLLPGERRRLVDADFRSESIFYIVNLDDDT
jgi:hypothetical protein